MHTALPKKTEVWNYHTMSESPYSCEYFRDEQRVVTHSAATDPSRVPFFLFPPDWWVKGNSSFCQLILDHPNTESRQAIRISCHFRFKLSLFWDLMCTRVGAPKRLPSHHVGEDCPISEELCDTQPWQQRALQGVCALSYHSAFMFDKKNATAQLQQQYVAWLIIFILVKT